MGTPTLDALSAQITQQPERLTVSSHAIPWCKTSWHATSLTCVYNVAQGIRETNSFKNDRDCNWMHYLRVYTDITHCRSVDSDHIVSLPQCVSCGGFGDTYDIDLWEGLSKASTEPLRTSHLLELHVIATVDVDRFGFLSCLLLTWTCKVNYPQLVND